MSILQEIAKGGAWSGLDIAKASIQGAVDAQRMHSVDQDLQIKAMEMADYLEKRERSKRLRASLEGADFTDYKTSAEAAQRASDAGEYETAISISKHALAQKPKATDAFGKMQDVFVGGKKVGVGQYDNEGKLHNFKTLKQMTDKGKGVAPTKARTPTKGQIERATDMIKKSPAFGEEGWASVGLSTKDNKAMGRMVASRAQKLISDAKQLGETISDEVAMDLAMQEVEANKDKIVTDEGWAGYSIKKRSETVFPAGISPTLQNYLGVDTPEAAIKTITTTEEYANLPSGTQYKDPQGNIRIKK